MYDFKKANFFSVSFLFSLEKGMRRLQCVVFILVAVLLAAAVITTVLKQRICRETVMFSSYTLHYCTATMSKQNDADLH